MRNISPSGNLTVSLFKATSNDNIVSNRGLRDLRHFGHKNLMSLRDCGAWFCRLVPWSPLSPDWWFEGPFDDIAACHGLGRGTWEG